MALILSPVEVGCRHSGLIVPFSIRPADAPSNPNIDTSNDVVGDPIEFSTAMLCVSTDEDGLALAYALQGTISLRRIIVDGRQLGVPEGIGSAELQRATVIVDGIGYRVDDVKPLFFREALCGWDLVLNR